jgi:iron complex outermembrane receptor protein
MSKRFHRALLAASAICGASATPAFAQNHAANLEEVVVTARRVAERLQDVPISITVFNQEQLAKQNIVNMADLAVYTPSLGTTNVLGNAQTTFSLRGFNQELTTSATVGVFFADVVAPRGASNQQPVGDGAGPGAFFDLQNVQVLKGPQGTLFGRNTTGGAILLVPQKPSDQFEGYAEGSVGNYNLRRFEGVINAPLGDRARLRLGIDRQKRDGYVRNNTTIGPSRFNDINYTAARASLVVDVTPNLENYSIVTYTHSKTKGEVNGLFAAQPAPNLTIPGVGVIPGAISAPFAFLAQQELNRYAGKDFYSFENNMANPRTQLDQWQAINTTTWRQSDKLTVKNIISYAQLKYDLVNPVIGTAFDLGTFNAVGPAFVAIAINPRLVAAGAPPATFTPWAPGTILPFTNSNPNGVGHTAFQSTFTEEFQLQGKALANKLAWQTGFYFEDSQPLGHVGSLSNNVTTCPDGGLFCANPFFGFGSVGLTESEKKIRTVGVYGQGSYDLTDKLKVTGGLRYTWDSQEATGQLINYKVAWNPYAGVPVQFVTAGSPTCVIVTASLANNCLETVSQKSHAPTWLIDFDYKPTDDILAYAKYARGYRTGGISFQLPPAIRTYGPEKVDSYEVGLKYTVSGPVRGIFNVAAFYNDFQNQQVPVGVVPKVVGGAANATGVVNAGKSRIYGLEAETSLELFEGFVASASYSYLNTRIQQLSFPVFNDAVYFLDPTKAPKVGDALPFTSKNKLSVSLAYTLPLDQSIGRVTLGATYTHADRQITNYSFRNTAGQLSGYSLLQPRDLVDLNLTWKGVAGSPVDLSVFANNVTQRHYYTYILDVGQGFQSAQLGLPRMFGMRLRYRWGG